MILILGIGNEMMGDDAFGPLVVKELKKKNVSAKLWSGSTPENFITKIKEPIEKLILLDTADLGEPPGTVKKINPSLVSKHYISTHKIPLNFLIRQLNPKETIFIAAQPKSLDFGASPSKEILGAIGKALKYLNFL